MMLRRGVVGLIAVLLGVAAEARTAPVLTSAFFKDSPCANQVLVEGPYAMKVPNWLINGDQNREICAYKFFAALFMLGYNTSVDEPDGAHLAVLRVFKKQVGLPAGDTVTVETLVALDTRLAVLEPRLAKLAAGFQLRGRMLPLHPNDVSLDTVAALNALAFSALPPELVMNVNEFVNCVNVNCLGGFVTLAGEPLNKAVPGVIYRFVSPYFNPKIATANLPSAASFVGTILHEFAHYIDGRSAKVPGFPVEHSVDTVSTFIPVNYKFEKKTTPCGVRKTNDPKDWVAWYGFTGAQSCPPGMFGVPEEFAEAFAMYVTTGTAFRAAAAERPLTIGRKYKILRAVFHQVEFATDLIRNLDSGCADGVGQVNPQPGYASCSASYVFEWALPKVKPGI